jgi:hypothetical protein
MRRSEFEQRFEQVRVVRRRSRPTCERGHDWQSAGENSQTCTRCGARCIAGHEVEQ